MELQAATAINDHHPDLAKLKNINKTLSSELQKVKTTGLVSEMIERNQSLQLQLEKAFKELSGMA